MTVNDVCAVMLVEDLVVGEADMRDDDIGNSGARIRRTVRAIDEELLPVVGYDDIRVAAVEVWQCVVLAFLEEL